MNSPEEPILSRIHPVNELPKAIAIVKMFSQDKWHDAQVFRREDLEPEDCIQGAATIVEKISTIIVEPNWQAVVSERNYLILERIS